MGFLDSISSGASSLINRAQTTVSDLAGAAQKAVDSGGASAQVAPKAIKDGFDSPPAAAPVTLNPIDQKNFDDAAKSLKLLRFQAADVFMKTGQYDLARQALGQMKDDPSIAHLGTDPFEKFKSQSVWDGKDGRSTTFKNHANFEETTGVSVDRKLAQIDQLEKMSKVIGHPVDPNNLTDVKGYFDKLSTARPQVSTGEIQNQFAAYTKNFYIHPAGVNWGSKPPVAERNDPARLTEMLKDQPKDSTGRTTLDCEGHTYLAGAIFGKNPRFDVAYASNASHIGAVVMEKGSNVGFYVNTFTSPVVGAIKLNNPEGIKKLGDQQKQHEVIAGMYLDGVGDAQATHRSHDLAQVNLSNLD